MRNFLMAMDADKILFPKYFALCPWWPVDFCTKIVIPPGKSFVIWGKG